MDINIQAKFNIGDKVWVPESYYDWYPIKKGYEIIDIEIRIGSNEQRVFYTIRNEERITQRYPERLCFSSYDECEQWCEENNKRR